VSLWPGEDVYLSSPGGTPDTACRCLPNPVAQRRLNTNMRSYPQNTCDISPSGSHRLIESNNDEQMWTHWQI
jgi:hypothetical protein